MRPRIEIKPVWIAMSDAELKAKITAIKQTRDVDSNVDAHIGSHEPRVALVMRYLEKSGVSRFFSGTESQEARKLCDEILKINPQNNFFNFARAALEDSREAQVKYLQSAAVYTEPYGEILSGQAAYELARLLYAVSSRSEDRMPFIETEAWFVRALMLGDQDAIQHFNQVGIYHETSSTSSMQSVSNCQGLFVSFLAVILSGRKIHDFESSQLLNNKCESARILFPSPMRLAHGLKDPVAALHQVGSSVRTIADLIVSNRSDEYMFQFFKYGYDMRILDGRVYDAVLTYLTTCGYELSAALIGQISSERARIASGAELANAPVSAPSASVDLLLDCVAEPEFRPVSVGGLLSLFGATAGGEPRQSVPAQTPASVPQSRPAGPTSLL